MLWKLIAESVVAWGLGLDWKVKMVGLCLCEALLWKVKWKLVAPKLVAARVVTVTPLVIRVWADLMKALQLVLAPVEWQMEGLACAWPLAHVEGSWLASAPSRARFAAMGCRRTLSTL